MSLPNEDNKDGTDDDPDLRMPYRKRKRFHEATQPQEKWREACYRLYPNLDSLSETQKELIESQIKVEYYIALGLNSSLPRTVTSGSIETPRVSPLLQHPPRVPSRPSPEPATRARPKVPVGPLSPFTLQPIMPHQPQLPPLLPVPPSAPLPPLSPEPRLSPLPLGPLQPLVPNCNPYLSSFYTAFDKPLLTSGPVKPLGGTFVKSEEDPFLKSDRIAYPKEEKPLLEPARYVKPLDDCFIKPIHPVSKPYKHPFLGTPKETYPLSTITRFQETTIGDPLLKRTANSSLYLEETPFKKPKRSDFSFEPIVDPFRRVSTTQLDREPFESRKTTVRNTSDDRYKKLDSFFETASEESSRHRDPFMQIKDPFNSKPDLLESFYNPSTSAFSVPKFAQSSSMYVDCPSIYQSVPIQYINLREEIADNNNNESVINNNDDEINEPIDYSLNHSSDFQP